MSSIHMRSPPKLSVGGLAIAIVDNGFYLRQKLQAKKDMCWNQLSTHIPE